MLVRSKIVERIEIVTRKAKNKSKFTKKMRPRQLRQEIRTPKHNEELTNLVLAISQRAPKAHRKKANDMRKQVGKSIHSFCIPDTIPVNKEKRS